jgi:hypothetical protein
MNIICVQQVRTGQTILLMVCLALEDFHFALGVRRLALGARRLARADSDLRGLVDLRGLPGPPGLQARRGPLGLQGLQGLPGSLGPPDLPDLLGLRIRRRQRACLPGKE